MLSIYVVFGATGQYDDYGDWPVIAFHSKRKATAYAKRADASAKALFETFPIYEPERSGRIRRDIPFGIKLPLDPNGRMDYNGTTYSVNRIPLGD